MNDPGSDNTISSIIQRTRSRPVTPPPAPAPALLPDDGEEDHLSYAKLRGLRQRGVMLECRLANGNSDAFDYGWLSRARFNPTTGIELQFGGTKVMIVGKNLRPLFEAITAHRVTWVAVLSNPAATRDPEATIVTAIEFEREGK